MCISHGVEVFRSCSHDLEVRGGAHDLEVRDDCYLGPANFKWIVELEYPCAVLLTTCLLVRLVVYLLGIEQVTRHLILLYQTSFDLVKVVFFFLLVNASFSLVLCLDYRFRREREEQGRGISESKREASQEFMKLLSSFRAFLVETNDNVGGEESTEKFPAINAGYDPWGMMLGFVASIGFTMVPFILSQSLLATLMGKRGEESQEQAVGIFKMGRAIVLMGIDDELLANEEDEYFVNKSPAVPGSTEWLFQGVPPADPRDKRDQADEADILKSTFYSDCKYLPNLGTDF